MLDLLELAVDAQLDVADREQVDPGLGFPGLDLGADPELPFPDSGTVVIVTVYSMPL
jgi:hypothetical protein